MLPTYTEKRVGQGASPPPSPFLSLPALDKSTLPGYIHPCPHDAVGDAMSDYVLEQDVFRLLRDEPFFAALSRSVNKSASRSIPTAGVRITDDGFFEMLYNPDFMGSLPDNQRRGILKHEFYHLIFEHCLARNPDGKKVSKIWNWATDLSINCHLKGELPEMGLMPEKFGFEDYLTAEQYRQLLEDKYGDADGDSMSGQGGDLDVHDGWGGDPNSEAGEAASIAKERLRDAMSKAADEAGKSSRGFGTMHQSVKEAIMRFISGSVDWRAVLRNFIGQSQRAFKSNTVKRINKRFPYIHAGRKTNRTANIAIAVDQSGSVDDEMLGMFFAELSNLAKIVTFDIVPFDTEVGKDHITVWEKGKKYTRAQRVMHGGTDFDAPTKYVNETPKYDGLIVLTDMQAPAPTPCRVRRLWITTRENKENPYFKTNELVIAVKDMAR